MGRKTGVTVETVKHLILDSGVIYLNWYDATNRKVLGACRGGNEFTVETEWRDMQFDGVGGIIRGARRPITTTVTLTANLVEISKEIIQVAIPGAEISAGVPAVDEHGTVIVGEKQYSVQRILRAAIPELTYYDVAIVSKYSGTEAPVVCVCKNAINNSSFALSLADQDEAAPSITFTGSFSVEDIDVEPWEIIIPEKD
jgi:hypothetical protein